MFLVDNNQAKKIFKLIESMCSRFLYYSRPLENVRGGFKRVSEITFSLIIFASCLSNVKVFFIFVQFQVKQLFKSGMQLYEHAHMYVQ